MTEREGREKCAVEVRVNRDRHRSVPYVAIFKNRFRRVPGNDPVS